MYVSVKGGEKAINNAHSWLSEIRRGDVNIAELNIKQISEQLTCLLYTSPSPRDEL